MGKVLFHGAELVAADVVCIVVHGRGQTQADMLDAIVSRLALPRVSFALPKSAGDAWYDARALIRCRLKPAGNLRPVMMCWMP